MFTFPFFNTIDVDFDGLELILTHEVRFSSTCRIHLLPRSNDVCRVKVIAAIYQSL